MTYLIPNEEESSIDMLPQSSFTVDPPTFMLKTLDVELCAMLESLLCFKETNILVFKFAKGVLSLKHVLEDSLLLCLVVA